MYHDNNCTIITKNNEISNNKSSKISAKNLYKPKVNWTCIKINNHKKYINCTNICICECIYRMCIYLLNINLTFVWNTDFWRIVCNLKHAHYPLIGGGEVTGHSSTMTSFHLNKHLFNKMDEEKMYLNLIKAIYDKPIANIIVAGEKLKGFLLRQKQDKDVHSHHFYAT